MKKTMLLSILFLVIGCFGWYYNEKTQRLGSFSILDVNQDINDPLHYHVLTFETCRHAKYYEVYVFSKEKLLFFTKTENNKVPLMIHNSKEEEVIIKVIAFNIFQEFKQSQYQIKLKKRIAVYLSPSNQITNYGVARTGYTNECEQMNLLANIIEKRLKEHGILVYRNSPDLNLDEMLAMSQYFQVDLHLALHSNAIGLQEQNSVRGIETWIYDASSINASLAYKLQEAAMSVYPYKQGNRGVRYTKDHDNFIREVNKNASPKGILMELGFHDQYDDALFIMNHKKELGIILADTIASYYGTL